MRPRIALLGLSGVGKSTIVRDLEKRVPLLHLQASALIKDEQMHRAQQADTSEALRTGAVINNQALLIDAFHRWAATTSLPIVFDAHSVIDGRTGLVEIPASVFAALNLHAICFLTADPEVIARRRAADTARERPQRDVKTLAEHQSFAQAVAQRIAEQIGRPFLAINDDPLDRLTELLVRS